MPRDRRILCAALRKNLRCAALAAIAPALLLVGNVAWANEAGADRAVKLLKVIPVPGTAANVTNGKLYSFDISWVDQATQTRVVSPVPTVS